MNPHDQYEANPYLHVDDQQIYNPLTDRTVLPGDDAYALFRRFEQEGTHHDALEREGWIVRVHQQDFDEIRARFEGSNFLVQTGVTNDRAGWLPPVGLHVPAKRGRLAGCDLVGSRPLQHLHITATGRCVLCCQDYDENYVVGDLKTQSLVEVLESDDFAKMRRWTYGIDEAPDDFICRTCVWARTRE